MKKVSRSSETILKQGNFIYKTVERNNNIDKDSVKVLAIKNTCCIICGAGFTHERAGKLYCSTRCRQTAYYHKDRIALLRESHNAGINAQPFTFLIKEYKKYLHYRNKIKDYKKLQSQFRHVEEGSQEWEMLYNSPNCALTWERKAIPQKIFHLNIPYLSIEQWSFIKSLYPEMNPVDLIDFVCSLSQDFVEQLNTSGEESNCKNGIKSFPVKNKYLHHLSKIVNGEVKFV
jgi:hypothetical protein